MAKIVVLWLSRRGMPFFTPLLRRFHWAAGIAAAVLAPAVAIAKDPPSPPFEIVWTQGACAKCETATTLAGVAFAADKAVWAFGFRPPGEMGSGDSTVLHSRDGGVSWQELGWTYTHNSWPMASFATSREGWVAAVDMDEADLRLMSSQDGAKWRRLPLRDLFINAIQYLGDGAGVAVSSDPYTHAALLHSTKDHGRRWSGRRLPSDLSVDQMRAADRRRVYLAGCIRGRFVVLATADGGRSWSRTQLPVTPGDPRSGGCAFEADGLATVGDREAWLLASRHSFGKGDTQGGVRAWRTLDGGRTWTETYRAGWTEDPEHPVFFAGPYVLGLRILIFRDADHAGAEVLYTADQGRSWSSAPLARAVADCAGTTSVLTCAGSTNGGFWLARVTSRP